MWRLLTYLLFFCSLFTHTTRANVNIDNSVVRQDQYNPLLHSDVQSTFTTMIPPYKLTATQVLELLRTNAITVEIYARSLLDRIKERDGIVKAWAYLGKISLRLTESLFEDPCSKTHADLLQDPEFVIKQARALDQVPSSQRGPLHGLAIGVKDIMNTKGDMRFQHPILDEPYLRMIDMPTQFGSPIYKGHQSGFDSSAVAILRAAGALIFGKLYWNMLINTI